MEVLEVEWEQLRLIREETIPIIQNGDTLDVDSTKGEKSLIGKICSNGAIEKEMLRKTIEKIRRISHLAIIKEMRFNHSSLHSHQNQINKE